MQDDNSGPVGTGGPFTFLDIPPRSSAIEITNLSQNTITISAGAGPILILKPDGKLSLATEAKPTSD